eukprot:g8816.t1
MERLHGPVDTLMSASRLSISSHSSRSSSSIATTPSSNSPVVEQGGFELRSSKGPSPTHRPSSRATTPTQPPWRTWSVEEVGGWLSENGFMKYIEIFERKEVCGVDLDTITAAELQRDFGIQDEKERHVLLNSIVLLVDGRRVLEPESPKSSIWREDETEKTPLLKKHKIKKHKGMTFEDLWKRSQQRRDDQGSGAEVKVPPLTDSMRLGQRWVSWEAIQDSMQAQLGLNPIRFWYLFSFCWVAFQQALLSMTFTSLPAEVLHYYPGWTERDINSTLMWNSVFSVIMMFPAGALASRPNGLKLCLQLGGLLVAAGSFVRILPSVSLSFRENHQALTRLLVNLGQVLNAMAGPLFMVTPTRLSFLWFPQRYRTSITAIAAVSTEVGLAAAFLLPRFENDFTRVLLQQATSSFWCVVLSLSFLLLPAHPNAAPSRAAALDLAIQREESYLAASWPSLELLHELHDVSNHPGPRSSSALELRRSSQSLHQQQIHDARLRRPPAQPGALLHVCRQAQLVLRDFRFVMVALALGLANGCWAGWVPTLPYMAVKDYNENQADQLCFTANLASIVGGLVVAPIADNYFSGRFKQLVLLTGASATFFGLGFLLDFRTPFKPLNHFRHALLPQVVGQHANLLFNTPPPPAASSAASVLPLSQATPTLNQNSQNSHRPPIISFRTLRVLTLLTGFFQGALVPLSYELSAEMCFPTHESIGSTLYQLFVNIGSALFFIVPYICPRSWFNFILTATMCACMTVVACVPIQYHRLEFTNSVRAAMYSDRES